jgi:hypothetical protein
MTQDELDEAGRPFVDGGPGGGDNDGGRKPVMFNAWTERKTNDVMKWEESMVSFGLFISIRKTTTWGCGGFFPQPLAPPFLPHQSRVCNFSTDKPRFASLAFLGDHR